MQVVARDLVTLDAQYASDLFIARALGVAGYSILLYEFFAAIPDEVRYIWPTRWSTVKIIYLANRYGNLVLLMFTNLQVLGIWRSNAHMFCYRTTLALALLQFVSFAFVHILVLLRAWATWGRHIKVLALLAALFVVYTAVSVSIITWGVISIGHDAYSLSSIVGTCIGSIPPSSWILWIPSIVLECAIFVLTMVSIRQFNPHLNLAIQSNIIRVIFRDGVVYFLVTLFSSLFNIFIWAYYANRPLNMLASNFTLCLVIATGQRLVLDLRKVSASDGLSTTRVGREIERAIEALPPSRSPSPIVFSEGVSVNWTRGFSFSYGSRGDSGARGEGADDAEDAADRHRGGVLCGLRESCCGRKDGVIELVALRMGGRGLGRSERDGCATQGGRTRT